jgi:spermidine synthase
MEHTHSKGFIAFLLVTALLCGALVMAVEVLGSRVIGPFFGVSLFVWTALITVTLVALAAGYAAGGCLADRKPSPDWLYGIILLAGVLVVLIPLIKAPILKACVPLGLRGGALASATLLFGPSLFLLGCVSPYLVRIAAREMQNLGRTVGGLYAISTVGSFIGTLFTGYFLIAWLGVNRIFLLTGLLLIGLAVVYFVLFRRKWAAAAALALPFLLVPADTLHSTVMPNGTRATVIYKQDSFYGNVKVVEYSYGNLATRELVIDGLVQGGIDKANGLSIYEYSYLMQFLPYALHPSGREALIIGLGAGIVPPWYESLGIATDTVDIDPEVVTAARRYFDFRPANVFVEDARYFLNRSGKRYDYLVLDVYNGDTTPGHLLSVEAMRLVKQRLTDRGVMATNLVGRLGRDAFATASVIRTLRAVFDQVEVYPLVAPGDQDDAANLAIIAYGGPRRQADLALVQRFPVHPLAERIVRHALANEYRFPEDTPAMLLTDDYNPLDFFDLDMKENVRRAIIDGTDWDILSS